MVVEFSVGLHRKVHADAIPCSSVGGEAGRLADRADGSAVDALVDRAARLPGGEEPVDPPTLPHLSARTEVLNDHLAGALAGDRAAVSRLLTAIRPLVVRYCRARVGRSAATADDVAQEVCLAVLTALPSYRDQGRPFLAFVYGIAAHKVADAHRARARDRAEPVPEVPDRMSSHDGPEEFVLQDELSGQMGRLLRLLPEKQREILVLRVVVGLSAEETAEAVGSTPGAVRVAQHRALGRLRKAISDASG